MIEGNYLRKKIELIKEKFQTKSGIFQWIFGTGIWSFIIINYTDIIFNSIQGQLSFLGNGNLITYISYIIFGAVSTVIGLGLSYALDYIYNKLF